MDLPYRMYDADNHLYETHDAFTRHLPAPSAGHVLGDRRAGPPHIHGDGRWWDYIPNPTLDPISRAGALTDMFAGEKSAERDRRLTVVEPLANHPEYQAEDAASRALDDQNVEAMLFPTTGLGHRGGVPRGPPAWPRPGVGVQPWLEEDWGFDYQGRMFATPIVSLADVDEAVRMLEWALGRGCRAIDLRSAPVPTDDRHSGPRATPVRPVLGPGRGGRGAGVQPRGRVGYTGTPATGPANYWFRAFAGSPSSRSSRTAGPSSDYMTAMICHGALAR